MKNFYQIARRLDEISQVTDPNEANVDEALKIIEKDEALYDYFFSHLQKTSWLKPLVEKEIFSTDKYLSATIVDKEAYILPFWTVLTYLENSAKKANERADKSLQTLILQVCRKLLTLLSHNPNANSRLVFSVLRTYGFIPTNLIPSEDLQTLATLIGNLRYKFSPIDSEISTALIPKLLSGEDRADCEKALTFLDLATRLTWSSSSDSAGPKGGIESYWLRELMKRSLEGFSEKLPVETLKLFQDRLTQIVSRRSEDTYSYIWRPAIEPHSQNVGAHDVQHVILDSIRDVALRLSELDSSRAVATLEDWFKSDFDIFRRLALHVVSKNMLRFSEMFWAHLDEEYFTNSNLKHELYELLKEHFNSFPPEGQARVLSFISNIHEEFDDPEANERINDNTKLQWLESIKHSGNENVQALRQALLGKEGVEPPEHPDFVSYTFTRVGDMSPYSEAELAGKPLKELSDFLNSYTNVDFVGPNIRGLASEFQKFVRNRFGDVEKNLSLFYGLKPIYQQSIIDTILEVWNAGRPVDWKSVLEFCRYVINTPDFWPKPTSENKRILFSSDWLVASISRLLKAGVRDDSRALDPSLNSDVLEILVALLAGQEPSSRSGHSDAYTAAINSARGTAIEALVNLALRMTRLADDKGSSRAEVWTQMMPLFEKELAQTKGANFEASALFGYYLPNLLYLNEEWTEKNISRIFSESSDDNWRAAVDGYSYVSTLYKKAFFTLKKHGVLRRAISTEFKKTAIDRFLSNVAIAYLQQWDRLSEPDGLLRFVIDEWDPNKVSTVIHYFWNSKSDKVEEKYSDLIRSFWIVAAKKASTNEGDFGNQAILSDLSLLSLYFPSPEGEHADLFKLCARYIDVKHNSAFFLPYVEEQLSAKPRFAAELFLEMLKGTTPMYMEETIISIVTGLYRAGEKEIADRICDIYARKKNFQLLRSTFDSFNPG